MAATHTSSHDLHLNPESKRCFASTLTWTLIRYIWELDQAVGRVVNALSNAGLAPEDTVIVFASDNGAPPETGADGRNWPLTGTHTHEQYARSTHARTRTQHTRTHKHKIVRSTQERTSTAHSLMLCLRVCARATHRDRARNLTAS